MALKDKLMTLEDFKAVRDVDVASNSAQFTEIKADLDDKTDELKSALVDIGVVGTPSINLLNPAEIKGGTGLTTNGAEYSTPSSSVSGFIPVTAGKDYSVFTEINGVVQSPYIGRIFCYDSNKANAYSLGTISSGIGVTPKTIPAGYAYCRFMIASSYMENPVMFAETDGTMPSDIPAYGDVYDLRGYTKAEETQALTSRVDDFEEIITADVEYIFYANDGEPGYCDASGTIQESTDYRHKTINLTGVKSLAYTGQIRWAAAYVAVFKLSNSEFTSFGQGTNPATVYNAESLVIPEDAVEVTLTWYQPSTEAKGVIVKTEQPDLTELVETVNELKLPWTGKTWVVVGDSLTEVNVATTKHYFDYIIDSCGVSVLNYGVGGSGYIRRYDDGNAFYQRVSAIPASVDFVTIFGSGNDMGIGQIPIFSGKTWSECLGTFTDSDATTICGAINKTLDNFFAAHPTTPIGIIAPTPWLTYPTTLLTNNWFDDYTNALKQICDYRGIPFLDLYHHSNLRPENEANCNACFYNGASLDGNGDGVHPNELGHKIIAPKIYEFVKTMLLD